MLVNDLEDFSHLDRDLSMRTDAMQAEQAQREKTT
jgi:hypothetical protein